MSTTDTAADNTIEGAIVEVKPDNALVVIDPARYAAELFQPFQDQLTTAKRKAARVTYDIATKDGMASAKELVRTFVKIRTSADKAKTEAKRPIDQAGKEILARFNLIKAVAEAEEDKHVKVIADEERRIEGERQRKLELERERVEAIEKRIANIRNAPGRVASADSVTINQEINQWTILRLDPADYQEYLEDALTAVNTTLEQLESLLASAQEREAEARRVAAEREELARLKAEQAERERVAAAEAAERARVAQAERDKAEADRQAAAAREADLQRQLAEMRAQMEAQQRAATPAPEVTASPTPAALAEVPLIVQGEPTVMGVDLAAPDAESIEAIAPLGDLLPYFDAAPNADLTEEWINDVPAVANPTRPTDGEILDVLAAHFNVSPATAIGWIKGMDL